LRVGELRAINSNITDSTPCVVDPPPRAQEIEELRKANAI
jgi:hypothetical protein